MTIEQLNAKYRIAGQLEFVAGNGGLPMIQVKTAKAKALISIHAVQVGHVKNLLKSLRIYLAGR